MKRKISLIDNNISINLSEDTVPNIKEVFNKLNQEVYGLKSAKTQILQAINDRKTILAFKSKSGKTKVAKTIASSLNLPFAKIVLSSCNSSLLLNHNKGPNVLLRTLTELQSNNPIILIDRIDKFIGPQYELLQLLDETQKFEHQELFSKVRFMVAITDETKMEPTLKDRLTIIELNYEDEELIEIVKNYILLEALKDKGFELNAITINDQAVKKILKIDKNLKVIERNVNDIVSKLSLLKSFGSSDLLSFKLKDFKGFPYLINEGTVDDLIKVKDKKKDVCQGMYL